MVFSAENKSDSLIENISKAMLRLTDSFIYSLVKTLLFLFEDNCFMMLRWSLPHIDVNQS